MSVETERKFLVADPSAAAGGAAGTPIRQGYLSTEPERVVRVRIGGDRAWITIKGRGRGASRPEYEYEIPVGDAEELLGLSVGPVLEKTRHRIEHAGRTWELDVFGGDNAGLVVAEVELPDEDAELELPPWIGVEVTGDPRFYNAALVARPFASWPAEERAAAGVTGQAAELLGHGGAPGTPARARASGERRDASEPPSTAERQARRGTGGGADRQR